MAEERRDHGGRGAAPSGAAGSLESSSGGRRRERRRGRRAGGSDGCSRAPREQHMDPPGGGIRKHTPRDRSAARSRVRPCGEHRPRDARRETSMRICAVDSLCAAPRIQEQQRGDADGAPPHHHRDGIGEVCLRAREHHLCAATNGRTADKSRRRWIPTCLMSAPSSCSILVAHNDALHVDCRLSSKAGSQSVCGRREAARGRAAHWRGAGRASTPRGGQQAARCV